MIAFRVQLNGGEAVTAGLPREHVVSIFAELEPSSRAGTPLKMSVHGLRSSAGASKAHVHWPSALLKIGDEITIAVVDVPESEISRPLAESAATEVTEKAERERLAHLLAKYGPPST